MCVTKVQLRWSLLALVFEYTKRVVADAFFSKRNFVDGLTKMGLKVISRFRDDAALYYLYKGPKTGLPGAPKKIQDTLQHVLHLAQLPEDGSQAKRNTLFYQ